MTSSRTFTHEASLGADSVTWVCLTDFREEGAPLGPEAQESEVQSILCIVTPRTWDLVSRFQSSRHPSRPSFMILDKLLSFCKLQFLPS